MPPLQVRAWVVITGGWLKLNSRGTAIGKGLVKYPGNANFKRTRMFQYSLSILSSLVEISATLSVLLTRSLLT